MIFLFYLQHYHYQWNHVPSFTVVINIRDRFDNAVSDYSQAPLFFFCSFCLNCPRKIVNFRRVKVIGNFTFSDCIRWTWIFSARKKVSKNDLSDFPPPRCYLETMLRDNDKLGLTESSFVIAETSLRRRTVVTTETPSKIFLIARSIKRFLPGNDRYG